MEVIIDNQVIEINNFSGSVLDLLLDIERQINQESRAVDIIKLNGRYLEEFNEAELQKMSLSEVKELEYITKSVQDLIKEGISLGKEYLPRLLAGIDNIIKNLENDEQITAFDLLANAVDGMQWYIHNLTLIKEVIPKYSNSIFNSLEQYLQNIIPVFREMSEAMESNDTVLLLDLLEYEIKPMVKQWITVNNELESFCK